MKEKIQNWLDTQKPFTDFLKAFLKLDLKEGGLHLVGGLVRDLLIDQMSDPDYDLMIDLCTEEEVQKCLDELKKQGAIRNFQKVGKSFPVYKIAIPGLEKDADLALARLERSTGQGHRDFEVMSERVSAKKDGERRDFTVNALFVKFDLDGEDLKFDLIDYFKGIDDLQVMKLRTVGDAKLRMEEDPLRILRAIRFAHQKGFAIDPLLQQVIENDSAELLPSLSRDRIAEEFLKTMMANPFEANRSYVKYDLYPICFPELFEFLPQKVEDNFPESSIEDRDLIMPLVCMPWLEMYGLKVGPDKLKNLENALRESHFPNPKMVRQVFQSLMDLKWRNETNHPWALQEKIMTSTYCETIEWLYIQFQRACMLPPLEKLPAAPAKIDGVTLQEWGFAPGEGFEDLVLRVRELQFKGEMDMEALKAKLLLEQTLM